MKKALVTGGSGGIGAAICRALARDGWFVTVGYHENEAAALRLAGEIGGQAVGADLRDERESAALMEAAGELDVLVNCAGVDWYGLLQDMDEADWRQLFGVNVDGMFRCCKLAIPAMVRAGQGCIINVASVLGLSGGACESAYSATKGAVISFTRALAKELGPSGIRVNCVAPGVIATDMCANLDAETMAQLARDSCVGRNGRPEDVAKAMEYLADAQFVTGHVLNVDGGYVM